MSSSAPRENSRLQSTKLPSPLTPILGRARELAIARTLLERPEVRLLTITGPGGIGKSRLAIEIGSSIPAASFEQVFFAQLAAASPVEPVTHAIVRSLGGFEILTNDGPDELAAAIGDRTSLLILDTFEHLLVAAPQLNRLLATSPNLKLIVTSRALLRLGGEFALPVPPLGLPDREERSLAMLRDSPSVRLFVDRVEALMPSFQLTVETAQTAAEICRHLDGLPLAIELAAAQSSVLPPAALLARIQARLPLPVQGPRDAPTRMRTIEDAVAWSYDLLDFDEQRLFRQVSVFSGGFSLDAAERVTGSDALTGLSSLVERNLVQQQEWAETARFSMLETIRSFAWSQAESCVEAEWLAEAHAEWALHLAAPAARSPLMPNQDRLMVLLELEHSNLIAALNWLDQRCDSARLLQLCASLGSHWLANGHVREGRFWLERALGSSLPDSGLERGRACVAMGRILSLYGDVEGADSLFDDAILELRSHEDQLAVASALIHQAAIANQQDDHERAVVLLNEALDLGHKVDDPLISGSIIGSMFANLGVAAHGLGDLAPARVHYLESLRVCSERSYIPGMIRALRDLGDIDRDLGDFASSLDHYRQSLKLLGERNDFRVIVDALEGAAVVAVNWQQPVQAARLLGAAETFRLRNGGAFIVAADIAAHERALALVKCALDQRTIDEAWAAGQTLSPQSAIAEVQAIAPIETTSGSIDRTEISLTPRETEILRLLVDGRTDRSIADDLFLSVRTVEAHVARVLAKLGVRTRTAAVRIAIGHGYIHSESHGKPQ